MAEDDHALRDGQALHLDACPTGARPAPSRAAARLAGRSPKVASSSGASSSAVMSPETPTEQPVAGEVAGDKGAAVVGGDRGHALGRAAGRAAIGMAGEGRGEPGARGEIVGVGLAPAQVGQDLAADALDRLGVEARRGQASRSSSKACARLTVSVRSSPGDAVAVGLELQPDRVVVELGAEGLAVIGAGTLVEQAGGHEGQALLARGVGGTAATEVQRAETGTGSRARASGRRARRRR